MFFNNLVATILLGSILIIKISQAQNSPQDYVNAHNKIRSEVGVGPITWNKTVAAYAQTYADSRIETCQLKHSYGPYGENIAEGYGNLNGVDAVKMWADEKPNYNYRSNSCKGSGEDECLHYTQVVWRNSVYLGCGRAKCKNGWWFVTCNYDPVGNIEGQRPY